MCTCREETYLNDEEEDEDLDKFPSDQTDIYINRTSLLERGCPVEKIVLKRGEEIVLKSASSYLT